MKPNVPIDYQGIRERAAASIESWPTYLQRNIIVSVGAVSPIADSGGQMIDPVNRAAVGPERATKQESGDPSVSTAELRDHLVAS